MFNRKLTGSVTCIIVVAALLVMSSAAFAENQEGKKAVFDFRIDDPKRADFVLNVIRKTYSEASNPDFVVIFMGNSSSILSLDPKDREKFAPEDQEFLDKVAATVDEMIQDGIKMEICDRAAANIGGIDPESVLSELTHVVGGWASLIDYELDGYALVPAF